MVTYEELYSKYCKTHPNLVKTVKSLVTDPAVHADDISSGAKVTKPTLTHMVNTLLAGCNSRLYSVWLPVHPGDVKDALSEGGDLLFGPDESECALFEVWLASRHMAYDVSTDNYKITFVVYRRAGDLRPLPPKEDFADWITVLLDKSSVVSNATFATSCVQSNGSLAWSQAWDGDVGHPPSAAECVTIPFRHVLDSKRILKKLQDNSPIMGYVKIMNVRHSDGKRMNVISLANNNSSPYSISVIEACISEFLAILSENKIYLKNYSNET
jgi:hypothetical protein